MDDVMKYWLFARHARTNTYTLSLSHKYTENRECDRERYIHSYRDIHFIPPHSPLTEHRFSNEFAKAMNMLKYIQLIFKLVLVELREL